MLAQTCRTFHKYFNLERFVFIEQFGQVTYYDLSATFVRPIFRDSKYLSSSILLTKFSSKRMKNPYLLGTTLSFIAQRKLKPG